MSERVNKHHDNRKLSKTASGALLLGLIMNAAYAFELGEAISQSTVHQPIDITVELSNLDGINPQLVEFRQATSREYAQFFLDDDATKYNIRPIQVYEKNGQTFVRLLSQEATTEEELTMILVAQWPGGMRYKAYSFNFSQPIDLTPSKPSPRIAQQTGPDVKDKKNVSAGAVLPPATKSISGPKENVGAGVVLNVPEVEADKQSSNKAVNTYDSGTVLEYGNAPSVVVPKGSSLWSIAGELPGAATRQQKMIALYQSNPSAFIDGNINLIKSGSKLVIPSESQLTQLSPKLAASEFSRLISKYSNSQLVAAKTRLTNGAINQSTAATPASGKESNGASQRVLTITQADSDNEFNESKALGNTLSGDQNSELNALQNRLDVTEQSIASIDQERKGLKQTAQDLQDALGKRESIINLPTEINTAVDEITGRENQVFTDQSIDKNDSPLPNEARENLKTEFDDSIFADSSVKNSKIDGDDIAISDSLDQDYGTDTEAPNKIIPNNNDSAVNDSDTQAANNSKLGWIITLIGAVIAGLWLFFRRKRNVVKDDFDQYEFKPVIKGAVDLQESESLIAKANSSLDGSRYREAGDIIEELIDRKTPHIMATIELVGRFSDLGSAKRSRLLVMKLNDLELTTKEEAALEELQDNLASTENLGFQDLEELSTMELEDRKRAERDAAKFAEEHGVKIEGTQHEHDENQRHAETGLAAGFAALVAAAVGSSDDDSKPSVGPIVADLDDEADKFDLDEGQNVENDAINNQEVQSGIVDDVAELKNKEHINDASDVMVQEPPTDTTHARGNENEAPANNSERIASDSASMTPAEQSVQSNEIDTQTENSYAEGAQEETMVSYDEEFNQDLPTEFDDKDGLTMSDDVDMYSSRLDLAKAYFEMGDSDTAEALLQPVITEGSERQIEDAKALLEKYTNSVG